MTGMLGIDATKRTPDHNPEALSSGQSSSLPDWADCSPHCCYEGSYTEPMEVAIDDIAIPCMQTFVAYWESLRGDRFAPSWSEFDLLALGTEAVPRTIVVDALYDPLRYAYRFWGTANVKAKGFDLTGKTLSDYPPQRRAMAYEEYRYVVEGKRPFAFKDVLVLPDNTRALSADKAPFTQIIVRLPLSNDGGLVDHVVSLCNWEKNKAEPLCKPGLPLKRD